MKKELSDCNVFIITVPTPVNIKNKPDLRSLLNATKTISKYLKHKDLVIFESTVHPGATTNLYTIDGKNSKIKCKNTNEKNIFIVVALQDQSRRQTTYT